MRAGATALQIHEPYLSGFPEDLPWALKAINAMVDGVDANITLHVCYGNALRQAVVRRELQVSLPAILQAKINHRVDGVRAPG